MKEQSSTETDENKPFSSGDLVHCYGKPGVCIVLRRYSRCFDKFDAWTKNTHVIPLLIVKRIFDEHWKCCNDKGAISADLCQYVDEQIRRQVSALYDYSSLLLENGDDLDDITNIKLICGTGTAKIIEAAIKILPLPVNANAAYDRLIHPLEGKAQLATGNKFTHTLQIASKGFSCDEDGVRLITNARFFKA